MQNLIDLIKETIDEIANHPLILVGETKFEPPIDEALVGTLERMEMIPVPENISQFYRGANGITLKWRIKPGLDEKTMEDISRSGEEAGYDYDKPLGMFRILPLDRVLINDWQPPKESEPGATQSFPFRDKDKEYTYATFGKKLKPFDLFHYDDVQCMAFIILPEGFKVMMLDDNYADWQNSRITDFENYIKIICKTRFTVPSRKRIFGKYRGDKEPDLIYEKLDEKDLTPALFK